MVYCTSRRHLALLALQVIFSFAAFGQVTVTVDLSQAAHRVSPYLYGRNNSLSADPGSTFTPEWTRLKDAGVRFFRESGGNNSTKYNWRLKISSHPDWYNNVYANDWSYAAKSLQQNIPSAQGMWAFQLLGKAAKTSASNFNDWGYNGSQWWQGVNQNLAGGGAPNTAGGTKALKEGDINLYLQDWTADSTTLVLNHWFNDLALDKSKLQYWNMDNEVEIWSGTHDDAMPVQITAEQFMQRYFAVAKKARQLYPEIKLVGPVTANEWQWYNWPSTISSGGRNYPWLEYFIKRVAEEQSASNIRLLDVLDLHFYPGTTDAEQLVQYHRVFFDKDYQFPEANGVKNVSGTWDSNQTNEYIFERCKEWLVQYIGASHGVTFGVTESGVSDINASTTAVWYASTLGELMKHPEMEIFTPWTWQAGMWEVLHLFSRFNLSEFVPAVSSEEQFVSAYPTTNAAGDSISVVLVNRSLNSSKSITLTLPGFQLADQAFPTLTLSHLSSSETFTSHSSNAIQKGMVSASANSIGVTLAPLSITTLQLRGQKGTVVTGLGGPSDFSRLQVYPNPVAGDGKATVEISGTGPVSVELMDIYGRVLASVLEGNMMHETLRKEVDLSGVAKGVYILRVNLGGGVLQRRISVR